MEGLTNIARHAPGASALVRLSVADGAALDLEITDDARSSAAWTPGVGIASMGERAAEVGGTLTAAATPTGGWVHAGLPITGGPSRAAARGG